MAAQSPTRTIDRRLVPSDILAVRTAIYAEIAAACAAAYARRLQAVLLTGSLARNEATYVREGEKWRLLSDADCMLVFATRASQPSTGELDELAAAIEGALRQIGVSVHIGLCTVAPSYLRSLPTTSFAYELRACGEVIWGDTQILETVPHYTAAELSREDAWRTLCNRMVELIACVDATASPNDPVGEALEYATIKLYLDMATSYLIFAGKYQPTYAGRAQQIRELAQTSSASPFPLPQFAQCVSLATERKIEGRPWNSASWDSVEEAIWYARSLWRWELEQLTAATPGQSFGVLLKHAARRQSTRQHVRGWLAFLRRTSWLANWREWPRWAKLSDRGTPRYLVYGVAMELFSRLPCLIRHEGKPPALDVDWNELEALLPERTCNAGQTGDWRQLAAGIYRNYQKFLMGTQA